LQPLPLLDWLGWSAEKLRHRRGQEARPNAQAQDLSLVRFDYFEVQSLVIELLARTRDVARNLIEQPCNGGRCLIRFIGKLDPE
jgi:hypothetical protein